MMLILYPAMDCRLVAKPISLPTGEGSARQRQRHREAPWPAPGHRGGGHAAGEANQAGVMGDEAGFTTGDGFTTGLPAPPAHDPGPPTAAPRHRLPLDSTPGETRHAKPPIA